MHQRIFARGSLDGGLAQGLRFEQAVEFRLQGREAAGEAGFLAMEVGERV
ncbi:MAG: hypothetical protein IT162_19790 [Bryobacterales bacterium]|nr:hypothetical protein [Bryobacterales bacterium]